MSSGISRYNTQTGLLVNNPEYPAIDEYTCNTCAGSGGGGCCVPVNGIIMYNDTDALFPNYILEGATWNICDGNNGTIDLRNKFVYGNDVNANLGTTGGAASIVLSVADLPVHTHPQVSVVATGTSGAPSAWGHEHNNFMGTYGYTYWVPAGTGQTPQGTAVPGVEFNSLATSPAPAYPAGIGNQTGDVNAPGGTLATHTHTTSITTPATITGPTGSGTAVDILNPYVKLYFIQRTL